MWVKTRTGSKTCIKYFSPYQCSMHWYLCSDVEGVFWFGFFPPKSRINSSTNNMRSLGVQVVPVSLPKESRELCKTMLWVAFYALFFFSFIFARGRIWHGGNVWTVGQTQKFKAFIIFFKLTFPCPFGYMRLSFLPCPKKARKNQLFHLRNPKEE